MQIGKNVLKLTIYNTTVYYDILCDYYFTCLNVQNHQNNREITLINLFKLTCKLCLTDFTVNVLLFASLFAILRET